MFQNRARFIIIDTDRKAATLKYLRFFSRFLDTVISIPFTNIRIGLDPIIGLMPALGDTLGIFLSAYLIIESARLGASRQILGKMILNTVVDATLGTVPVLGDIFDIVWKGNQRNMVLLEQHLQSSLH
ncbi:hypothetical protein RINTHH_16920 [Richelia intracellularis HH01]|uniref:DUF4112 domain-containing protein n=1 Tax=Richelia intracellularis HH01 TaxID=1165094 RepID=M1WZS4_9NOST|nr:DUF4112 domain-containing protein [Richelia intracellularis]CCH67847.1 hypothetical protein RINTHH_16920 [Richelia intracellularis HH01]